MGIEGIGKVEQQQSYVITVATITIIVPYLRTDDDLISIILRSNGE